MFSFFKKNTRQKVDLSALGTDMHSHLIAGIDDGAEDEENSLLLCKGLEELGYKKCITTPHIMWDLYKNTSPKIQAGLGVLENNLKQHNVGLKVKAAAEYFLDDYFDELLKSDTPLLTVSGNMVLVECSFVSAPFDLKEKLFTMQMKGYKPILAHPERYLYFARDKGMFDVLKNAGCLFQLNILSLCGYYGKASQVLAEYLISKRYVDLVGTDMHHERHLETLRNGGSQLMDTIHKLMFTGQILNPTL
jgi:tyrosine-protein phosphatase YwqE